MTPFWQDDHLTLYGGDCREVMAEMPAESVHCVVTSPPYWGLRDYGVGGQLGLEATPEAYVANMVGVFREVRRVLRSDGTLWLNLGASYMTTPAGNKTPSGFQQRSAGGQSGALAQWQPAAAGASGRSRSRQPERAPAYGTDGTGPLGSSAPGSACSDLCDGCRAALSSRTTDTPQPLPVFSQLRSPTGRGTEPPGSGTGVLDALPLAALASTMPRSETPPPGPCSHCGNCGACLSVMRSPSRDARECVRRSADNDGTESTSAPSAAHTSGTEPSGLAWGDYTSTIKPKDMVPIPWMVAMALQADGWYLRSDIIWAKPNPMPESVTDRPTKAHEYLFLLSKSARYHYDAEAVREAGEGYGRSERFRGSTYTNGRSFDNDGKADDATGGGRASFDGSGRNLRSVWTIATEPYPGAHFATFPRKLVEPCIKAGCPEGGTVLDPFAGSGTTLLVAQVLGRRGIGIDLNPDYLKQAIVRASRSFGKAAITEDTSPPTDGLWEAVS